jgi:hypothetical protein
VDDDPQLELVVSGYGGLDVIETRGFGANTEHFQRRRSYQRLNVRPWAYEDSYFIERGRKKNVVNVTDNLVMVKQGDGYSPFGEFMTELLTLPPDCEFRRLEFDAEMPVGTEILVDVVAANEHALREAVGSGTNLGIGVPVRLLFRFSTSDATKSPMLHSFSLAFDRRLEPSK